MSRSGIEYFFALYSAMRVRRRPKLLRLAEPRSSGMVECRDAPGTLRNSFEVAWNSVIKHPKRRKLNVQRRIE